MLIYNDYENSIYGSIIHIVFVIQVLGLTYCYHEKCNLQASPKSNAQLQLLIHQIRLSVSIVHNGLCNNRAPVVSVFFFNFQF